MGYSRITVFFPGKLEGSEGYTNEALPGGCRVWQPQV